VNAMRAKVTLTAEMTVLTRGSHDGVLIA
jgi:hypothetical protein